MGMFDSLTCEVPLPDGYVGDFQTKDFDCGLDHYAIRADGRLEVLRFDLVSRPGWKSIADGSMFMRENERWEPFPFHGHVNFYDYNDKVAPLVWREYDAKFTAGVLVDITALTSTTEAAQAADSERP